MILTQVRCRPWCTSPVPQTCAAYYKTYILLIYSTYETKWGFGVLGFNIFVSNSFVFFLYRYQTDDEDEEEHHEALGPQRRMIARNQVKKCLMVWFRLIHAHSTPDEDSSMAIWSPRSTPWTFQAGGGNTWTPDLACRSTPALQEVGGEGPRFRKKEKFD